MIPYWFMPRQTEAELAPIVERANREDGPAYAVSVALDNDDHARLGLATFVPGK
jgi:hypothetical protein